MSCSGQLKIYFLLGVFLQDKSETVRFVPDFHSSSEFSRFLTSPDNRADCCPCTDCQVLSEERPCQGVFSQRDVPTLPACPLLLPPGLVQILSSHPSNLPTHPTSPGSLADRGISCFLVTYEPAELRLINLLHLARRARPATAFRAQQLT